MSDILENQIDKLLDQCFDWSEQNESIRWLFSQSTSAALKNKHLTFDKFIFIGKYEYQRFLDEIIDDDWLVNTNRQNTIEAQKQTENIFLRKAKAIEGLTDINHNQEVRTTSLALDHYPKTLEFLNNFALNVGAGKLERAMIVNLKPYSEIGSHIDGGLYYLFRDRYHLVLKSNGSLMQVHNEQSTWHEGEMWWFQNKLFHQAFNNSNENRIHIIFDVLPFNNIGMVSKIRRKIYEKYGVDKKIIENY